MSDEAEEKDPRTPVMPTVWRTSDGRAVINDGTSIISKAGEEEQRFLEQAHDVCGTCKYFEHVEGQAQMEAQKFIERLVREQSWQTKHLVSPVNELGLCGAYDAGTSGDQTLTGKMHKACDQYREDRGRFSLRKANS